MIENELFSEYQDMGLSQKVGRTDIPVSHSLIIELILADKNVCPNNLYAFETAPRYDI